ncbi:uncharacterized protein SPAPADRAFT_58508 [Spathaspora passalidarum NRRL Y-27907]|uniref:Acyl carrier protein n=1 Tax=Spathaspora passalidarum (strain NRRL Y-27907 / 11-Y1) TaxID=619300 RepID=G3AGF1_SPAPN|nr:uncharacterized protein SPAPADRAFT_58508 [Spathaspora passalidarum NRRL Y-27907]EGW35290.1 hypothetical protein SPAPADRAFT_58508 [Spathaspora passalidarum NRRL Y-27907]
MFRNTVLRSLRAPVLARVQPIVRPSLIRPMPTITMIRSYAAFPALTRELAKERILELLEGYDKTILPKEGDISEDASFVNDLGLDSLDVVEIVIELEHEFNIQIPDNEADSLKTVGQTIDFIMAQPDAV